MFSFTTELIQQIFSAFVCFVVCRLKRLILLWFFVKVFAPTFVTDIPVKLVKGIVGLYYWPVEFSAVNKTAFLEYFSLYGVIINYLNNPLAHFHTPILFTSHTSFPAPSSLVWITWLDRKSIIFKSFPLVAWFEFGACGNEWLSMLPDLISSKLLECQMQYTRFII